MSWYNSSWTKRKPITLTGGASGAQSDYQVKLTITYDSDMKSDFSDLRFTKADGTTLLDAWMESHTASTSAIIWVETDTPANTVEADIYVYYGNGAAASYWDGDATFPDFFDDFESVADWDYSSNYDASSYSFTATSGIGDMMVTGANSSHIVRYKKDCSFDTTNMHMLLRFKGDTNTQIYIDDTAEDRWRAAWLSAPSSYTIYDEGWDLDGTVTNIRVHTRGVASGTQHNYFDYIAFRKYVANPATYAFGSEESSPAGWTNKIIGITSPGKVIGVTNATIAKIMGV